MPDTGGLTMTTNAKTVFEKVDTTGKLVAESKTRLLHDAAQQGAEHLRATVPRLTGEAASQVGFYAGETSATITAPSYPLIFLEAGSLYPRAKGEPKREHKKLTSAQRKAGHLRIKGRHFLSQDRLWTRKLLTNELVPAELRRIEAAWSK